MTAIGNYEEYNEGGPDDVPLPTALLGGGDGSDTLYLDFSSATAFGSEAATVLVYSIGGGNYGVSVADDVFQWNAPAADVYSVDEIVMAPSGPTLRYVGDRGPFVPAAVRISGSDGADSFFGGRSAETVDLRGGDDVVSMNLGADVIATGTGHDDVLVSGDFGEPSGVPVTGTVTDFDPANDTLVLRGFDAGEVSFREDAAGTWVYAPGEANVLLAGVSGLGNPGQYFNPDYFF